jgi:hypothetical protein
MARAGVTIIDRDHGWRALIKRVEGLKEPAAVAVGILARDASKDDGGSSVLKVGTANEFGVRDAEGNIRIPERSFVRAWFDENRDRAQKVLRGLFRRVIAGQLTEEQALDQFGAWAVGEMQARIARGVSPPNAQSTIDRKGSSTPLIDEGILRSALVFEVRR